MIEGPKVTFGSWLQSEDIDLVRDILGAWAETDALRRKDRIGFSELSLDSDSLEIHAFHFTDAHGDRTVQVMGAIAGDLRGARARIEDLHARFERAGIKVSTEFEGCDAEGESITDEFSLP